MTLNAKISMKCCKWDLCIGIILSCLNIFITLSSNTLTLSVLKMLTMPSLLSAMSFISCFINLCHLDNGMVHHDISMVPYNSIHHVAVYLVCHIVVEWHTRTRWLCVDSMYAQCRQVATQNKNTGQTHNNTPPYYCLHEWCLLPRKHGPPHLLWRTDQWRQGSSK